jgi:hypothetical protein
MARTVRLRQSWTLGKRIGDRSGFGQVFLATAEDGTEGVVKLIPKQPGADRELLFEELAGVPNVVPIVDSGETGRAWAIAMPRADRSLRAEMTAAGGALEFEPAVNVLTDLARALTALDGRVVHRDLKPENVLSLGGAWSVADFGIARYAEASTASDTWKDLMSAAYAAPERWRLERATGATDVYSLGIVAFEILSGGRPFPGPGRDDFRDQHLHRDAPALGEVPPSMAGLVAECLFKAPGARPSAANVLARLERAGAASSPGRSRLQAANVAVRAAQAEEQARLSAATSESERRDALFTTAERTLKQVSAQLREAVLENAPAATPVAGAFADDWALRLGTAVLGVDPATRTKVDPWGGWKPAFEVIAFSVIGISIPQDQYGNQGRLHSLWYCDAKRAGEYRWYETGFMVSPHVRRDTTFYPVAFEPSENAGKALANAIAEWQVAWPFTPVDQGDEGDFIERWLDWFGTAAAGQMSRPANRPERQSEGTWRRS